MKTKDLKRFNYDVVQGGEVIADGYVEAIDLNQARRVFAQEIADMFANGAFDISPSNPDYEYVDDHEADQRMMLDGLDTTWYRGPGWYEIYTHKDCVFMDSTKGVGFDRFTIRDIEIKLVKE